ncbi:MAG: cbb3-type cytochrome c oxidase subunit 3 [Bdellovibrionales bacterium]|nr:cbb3-type cytochrome c oxidase subunit 3 [Bdellovibrionales bacterium]
MKQEGLKYFTHPELMAIAFTLFMVTFVGIIFWTFRKSAKKEYEQVAQAPLQEETLHGQN